MATSMALPVVETTTVNGMSYGPRSTITFNGSPVSFQNMTPTQIMVLVTGGNVSLIEFSRDGVTFDSLGGLLSGDFFLNPWDWLRITYLVAPTAVYYPI